VLVDLIGQEVWDEPAQLGCVPRSAALTANPNKPPEHMLKPPGHTLKPQWRSVKQDVGLCPAGLDTPYVCQHQFLNRGGSFPGSCHNEACGLTLSLCSCRTQKSAINVSNENDTQWMVAFSKLLT
jgi:hypothetical protein